MKNLYTLIFALFMANISASSLPLTPSNGEFAQLRSNLYIVSPGGTPVLMDGSLTQYNSSFSNDLNGMDARKMTNPSENWGMLRNKTVYVIERRHSIVGNDSIFFKMWNMRIITYRLEFITSNLDFPGRTGILQDKYLKTSTIIDLNGTTYVNFSVTADPASAASDRFQLIFSNNAETGFLPVEFAFTNAIQKSNSVLINWAAVNAGDAIDFNIEKSNDGIHFEKTNSILVHKSNSQYQYIDNQPLIGDSYYRIVASANNKITYSETMKVSLTSNNGLNIFPNPASATNLNLQLTNQPTGIFKLRLMNSYGQAIFNKDFQFAGGNGIQKLQPTQTIAPGIYQLEIISPDGSRKIISIVF